MKTVAARQPFHLSESDYRRIRDIIYRHCGINLHEGKKELVRARLSKLIRLGRYADLDAYLESVTKDRSGKAFSQLVDAISTNLTSFFREDSHFDFLRQTLLPSRLSTKRRQGTHRLRIWSAGCSSGEEPYSLAITLLENLPKGEHWDVKILASDISTCMLKAAEQGIYDRDRIQPVTPAWRTSYLHSFENGQRYQVQDRLKTLIAFRYLNLMKPWPFRGPFDVIFCRNVMIYFDKPTQQKLIERFYDVLDHGAMLFTGHSESLTGITHRFQYVRPTIYLKA